MIMQTQAVQNTLWMRLLQQQGDFVGLQLLQQQAQQQNSQIMDSVQLQQPAVQEVDPLSFVSYIAWKKNKSAASVFCDWFLHHLPSGYNADIRNKKLKSGTANAFDRCKSLVRWLLRFSARHPPPRPRAGSEAYVRWTRVVKSIADGAVNRIMEEYELANEKKVNHSFLKKHRAVIDDMPVPEGTPQDSVLREKPKPRGSKRAREEDDDDDEDDH